ncbi:MAG: NAD(P)/FAD-dependent oxidoreductase [Lachnospiraceae bacterium]|nr:NAD(P)/FAD-dependent oxidoreductase [Lachnospiraceae bacterium]
MKSVIVIGGGAAGMMAAIGAAREGASVTLLEKNEKLGKKIYITGKGRCNLTNACNLPEFAEHVVTNRQFLQSALHGFTNADVCELFEELGMPVKTERGNRVFPVSDKSSDVIRALERECRRLRVTVRLHTEVKSIRTEAIAEKPESGDEASAAASKKKKSKITATARATGVVLSDGTVLASDAVILATGGLSYPTTGSTGDGYRMAKALGHGVTRLVPSLVSLTARESFCATLAGLSLRNVSVRFCNKDGKVLREEFGELLFTHKGISGPVVLTATAFAADALVGGTCEIDLKPALSDEQWNARVLRELEAGKSRQMKTVVGAFAPAALGAELLAVSGIDPAKTAGSVTREERMRLAGAFRHLTLHIDGMGGYNEAVVTKGGIEVSEVNPSTMESRLVKGLYLAGEVLDVDATTGGFNLQIAWSTGMLAGRKAAKQEA